MSTPALVFLLVGLPLICANSGFAPGETRSLAAVQAVQLSGIYFEDSSVVISAHTEFSLRLVGYGVDDDLRVLLTTFGGSNRGDDCEVSAGHGGEVSANVWLDQGSEFEIQDDLLSAGLFNVKLDVADEWFYLCLQTNTSEGLKWKHQGTAPSLRLKASNPFLPTWLVSIFIVLLLALSGMFSGLNLGLMSLDPTDLQVVSKSGSNVEKKYAKVIMPVRKRGSFLLCTLLFGNVLVNSSLTIMLDSVGGGMVAVIASTLGIVIFGEIVPQAICSRHGLAVGARTIWLTKFFMLLTFPLSFPMSKVLDCILGAELGQVYSRDRLQELVKLADKQDIVNEELNIIQGALQLTKKYVVDVMTPLEDVFMVDHGAILDFETMSRVMNTGYTRIPVFETDRTNIIAILNIKDLAFVDPDDNTPLKTVCRFYNHPIVLVFDDARLDQLLEEFKKGKSHMSFVQRVVEEAGRDPYYEIVGLITLEDVIEEIIQSEILDETDIIIDNKSKKRRQQVAIKRDYSIFNTPDEASYRHKITPQLALASFQFLSTTVDPFKPDYLSANVLKRLLKQDILVSVKLNSDKPSDHLLYTLGKPSDYFVMITEGRCRVDVGRDSMSFEVGPFTYFGSQALLAGGVPTSVSSTPVRHKGLGKDDLHRASNSSLTDLATLKSNAYIPDYSLVAVTDCQILRIRRLQYVAAIRATLMERHPSSPRDPLQKDVDIFSLEWKKASRITQQQTTDGLLNRGYPITANGGGENAPISGSSEALVKANNSCSIFRVGSSSLSNMSAGSAPGKVTGLPNNRRLSPLAKGLHRQETAPEQNTPPDYPGTLILEEEENNRMSHQQRSGSMDGVIEGYATEPLLGRNGENGELDRVLNGGEEGALLRGSNASLPTTTQNNI